MKRIIIVGLVLLLSLSSVVVSFASVPNTTLSTADIEALEECIEMIEVEFATKGYAVKDGFEILLSEYENEKENTTDLEEIQKLNALISSTRNMMDEYEAYTMNSARSGNLAGTAVNAMYLAQQNGILVPFYTTIRTT